VKQIILNGYMGTGKTTLGKAAAEKLGCAFYDLDHLIEQEDGKSVQEIFSSQGEVHFRRLETEMLVKVLQQEGVIALGGGTLTHETNKERVLASDSLLIGLSTSVEEIVKRVAKTKTSRPMLATEQESLADHVQAMLKQRKRIYQNFDFQIDTQKTSIDQPASQMAKLSRLTIKRVMHPDGFYPIVIGRGTLSSIGELIALRKKVNRVIIVSNSIVSALYLQTVKQSLVDQQMDTDVILIPDGEEGKSLETIKLIYEQLSELHADRNSLLLALGGGITGDICGFAAATYMRGITFVQVPTTLVSMVDSSIGGKTGVNLSQGKNLVGSFKQPELVVMDLETLKSLPYYEVLNGFGEFLKHGLIASPELVQTLLNNPHPIEQLIRDENFQELLIQSLEVKRQLVQEDPFEENERMKLNFGHTLGHAIEKASNFQVSHGEAVLMGMWFASMLSNRLGFLSEVDLGLIDQLYRKYNLPRSLGNIDPIKLDQYMLQDKKKDGKNVRWVLLHHIGEAFINTNPSKTVLEELLITMGAK
jgi:shikimate kinase/3-dehydroquinate synthase